MVRIAVPNKGRLSEATLVLFDKAGVRVEVAHDRKLFATAKEHRLALLFVRAQDIPRYVESGVAQLGVTGLDILEETGHDVERLLDLKFGKCRLVLAAPDESPVKGGADVPDGARVATSFPNLTRAYFEKHGKVVKMVEVSGATELTPHIGVADFITDLTSSGATLAMNALREVDTLLESSAHMVANRDALTDPETRVRIHGLLASLESVVQARGKRYLMANVPRGELDAVRALLPGINGPTVMDLYQSDMVAAHAVVGETDLDATIQALKKLGATGILVLPIERLVP